MTDTTQLVSEIVDRLEQRGIHRSEYRLYDVIDPTALARLVESGAADLRVFFTIDEYRIEIGGDGEITVEKCRDDRE